MKTYRKLVLTRGDRFSVRWREQVFAVEPASVAGQPQHALVHDVENVGIAVVGGAQLDLIGSFFARDADLARPVDHRRAAQHALERA